LKQSKTSYLIIHILHRGFEYFILSIIVVNSISLAIYDYADQTSVTLRNQVLDKIGVGFSILFLVESMLKILAYGFFIHRHSYLRNGWNIIDFIVALAG
jgi:hypothetical protein